MVVRIVVTIAVLALFGLAQLGEVDILKIIWRYLCKLAGYGVE